MTVLLARTEKGISAFFAPMRRRDGRGEVLMNGVAIQRLKPKLGTRPLPTGELVLSDMRAWLIGKEGEGIREIATVLNITRIHTALIALGLWGRGLAISRAYSKVRKVEGRLLMDNESHVRTMAENHVSYVAHMHLGFFTVALLGISEHPRSFEKMKSKEEESGFFVNDLDQVNALLRLLTPVAKAQCSKAAIKGLQECMESLGGIGYLEDEQQFNVARLFRDANVMSIWEGTTDVMASDVVRVMKGKDGGNIRKQFNEWVSWRIEGWGGEWEVAELVRGQLGRLEEWWIKKDVNELRFLGRQILELLAWVTATILLIEDSRRDEDDTGKLLARRWISTLGADVGAYTTRYIAKSWHLSS